MKLIVFCLFTVCCWTWMTAAQSSGTERNVLRESLKWLRLVKNKPQHSKQMLSTPPSNVTDCCSVPALECFRSSLQGGFNISINRELKKINKTLGNSQVRSLNFCSSGEDKSACPQCNSYPQENVTEFFSRLESLMERTIARLSMD